MNGIFSEIELKSLDWKQIDLIDKSRLFNHFISKENKDLHIEQHEKAIRIVQPQDISIGQPLK